MSTPSELDLMSGVDTVEWGPTEPDEIAVLDRFFFGDVESGTYSFRVGSLMANSVASALNEAQKHIGVKGRPNKFSREYASRHGNGFLTAPWCDMYQTYISRHAPAGSIVPKGDRAYTPWHAQDFFEVSRGYSGTAANIIKHAKPGAIIFFDWGGSNVAGNVDHVGMVVKNLNDGRLITIEGNTSDMCALRTRGADVIATIGVPAYVNDGVKPSKPVGNAWPYGPNVFMKKGWTASGGVKKVQRELNSLGYLPKLIIDGDFGTKTENAVKWYQRKHKLAVDGVIGPVTWNRMFG